MTYTIGSLFSGYGGLDMGVQLALGPARTAWVSDIEPGPCALLAHHWPDAPNLGDITTVDWTQVEPVDVIAGGSPCQDLSTAGRRAGMKPGTRSGLWESMFHAITTIRPHLVVWENVRGALSAGAFSLMESREGRVGDPADGPVLRALGRVLGDLASIGYDAQWVGLRASDVGAPHQRYRVFVAAHPQGDTWWLEQRGTLDAADTESIGLERFWSARGWGDGSADSGESPVALLPTPRCDNNENRQSEGYGPNLGAALLPTPTAERYGSNQSPSEGAAVRYGLDNIDKLLPTPTTQDTDEACPSQLNRNTVPLNTLVTLLPTPRASDGEHGGPNQRGSRGDLTVSSAVHLMPTPSVADVEGGRKSRSGERGDELLLNGLAAQERFGDYAPAIARWEELTRLAPAPTEESPRGGQRLSPRFVEWMIGLPDGWVTSAGLSRVQELRACGNGVVPQQAAHALRVLAREQTDDCGTPNMLDLLDGGDAA